MDQQCLLVMGETEVAQVGSTQHVHINVFVVLVCFPDSLPVEKLAKLPSRHFLNRLSTVAMLW